MTYGGWGEIAARPIVSMSGGGSGAASPEEGGSGDWRDIYDRVEALLPRVEALAADRARLQEALSRTQRDVSGARESSLHARLLQAEASRRRWKTAYIELPLLANPMIAELQERDLEDSRSRQALIDSAQEGATRHGAEISGNDVDYEDVARDLRAELAKLRQAYQTLSIKQFTEDAVAQKQLQQKVTAPKKMRIFVNILNGRTITLEVTGSDTIYDVKAKIQDKEGILAGQQRLIFNDVLLVGSSTLARLFVEEDSTFHLVLQGMHVFLKTLLGKITTLEVEDTDTIYDVKAKVFDETGDAPKMQQLIFAGRLLEEARTLAHYGIQNDSTLHLQLREMYRRSSWRTLTVWTRAGKKIIERHVMPSETVGDVKETIYVELGIPTEQQCLFMRRAREPLEDGCAVVQAKECCSCDLRLQLRLPVGQ